MSSRATRAAMGLLLSLLAIGLTGCGNGLATVTGNITVDGQPLVSTDTIRGMVCFYPAGGTGAPAVGLLDASGEYEIRTGSKVGVEPGSYLVTVSAAEVIPSKIEGAAPNGRALTPRRYANPTESGFRVTVGEGSNEFDFDLDGTPDKPRRTRGRRR